MIIDMKLSSYIYKMIRTLAELILLRITKSNILSISRVHPTYYATNLVHFDDYWYKAVFLLM